VWHPVPSLNQIATMSRWQLMREKLLTKAAVLSALRASAGVSATNATSTTNISLMLSQRLAASLMTRRNTSKWKSSSSRLKTRPTNVLESKSVPANTSAMNRAQLIEHCWSICQDTWNRLAFDAFMETLGDQDLRYYIAMGKE